MLPHSRSSPAVAPQSNLDGYYIPQAAVQAKTRPQNQQQPRGCPTSRMHAQYQLLRGCTYGDPAAVQAALNSGACASDSNIGLLHVACRRGHAAVVQRLLAAGADVDAEDATGSGLEAIRVAKESGDAALQQLLMQHWFMTCITGCMTPLYEACKHGHAAVVQLLLEAGTSMDRATGSYTSPLHAASFGGSAAVVQVLLQAGADISYRDRSGHTPFHMACLEGHAAAVQLLLQAGARVNDHTYSGTCPLHLAGIKGSAALVSLLVAAGADVHAVDHGQQTALHWAASRGNVPAVQTLLAAGAAIGATDAQGRTPLMHACFDARFGVVAALVQAGANPDMQLQLPGINTYDLVIEIDFYHRVVQAQRQALEVQRLELEQLRSIQPGVQQLIIGAAGMMKRLQVEQQAAEQS